jgi:excisionase family DNA binding protein
MRSSRKTAWWHGAWKPAGRPGSPPSPRPGKHWKPPGTRCRRCPAGPTWRNSPLTCPRSGTPPPPAARTRKRLLRSLIADVTLLAEPDPGKARIGIRWHTGATDEFTVARAIHPGTARRSPSPAVEMVRELGPATPTAELAEQMNAAGLTTGSGRPFDVKAVQWIRHAYQIPAPAPYAPGEVSVAEAARRLGCSTGVIYYWIEAAQLDARRGPGNRLRIPWTARVEAACRQRITGSGHLSPPAHRAMTRHR